MGRRSVNAYDFDECLALSKSGPRQATDIATLKVMFPESVSIQKTTDDQDRMGVDYVITLRRGAMITVDAKTRTPGCSEWWVCRRSGQRMNRCTCLTDFNLCDTQPEVALEFWNVKPTTVGWTLDESKNVDLILFTFATSDHRYAYARSFPLLREAFRRNYSSWIPRFKTDQQTSYRAGEQWHSECVFVPLHVVDEAISAISKARLSA